jgi:hypothetical protein
MVGGDMIKDNVLWFKFNATANTQYFHLNMTDSSAGAKGQLYDNTGAAVGDEISYSYYGKKVESRTVVNGNEYYFKVTLNYNYGLYQLGFNTTEDKLPGFTVPNTGVIDLTTINKWGNGNLAEDGVEWFKFTAAPNTYGNQYIFFKAGTLTYVYVQLCAADGTVVGRISNLFGSSSNSYTSESVTSGDVYYIRVTPENSSSGKRSGTYKIAFADAYNATIAD